MRILSNIALKLFYPDKVEASKELQSIPEMINSIFNIDNTAGTSITTVSRRALVGSTVYIEESLINEEISVPLLGTINQIYVAHLLTALKLFNVIESYKKISSSLSNIGVENYSAVELRDALTEGFKKFGSSPLSAGLEAETGDRLKNDIDESVKHLAAGRMMELDIRTDKDRTMVLPLYVQMYPITMASEVAEGLIKLNYPESFLRRLFKARSKEIRRFRDFVLGMDLVEQHAQVLKADKNNIYSTFYKERFAKQSTRVVNIATGKINNNLANSVMIITEETLKKAMNSSQLDFDNSLSRQQFFDDSYCMCLAVVDTNYNMVDFYYNGIPKKSEIPFRAIKQAGSSKSGIDIEDIIKAFAAGTAPRF